MLKEVPISLTILFLIVHIEMGFSQTTEGQVCLEKFSYFQLPPVQHKLDDTNFFKNILHNKRLILLGELAHMEGTVTLTKLQVIRHLHEELGYNVLVFEDNFYELYRFVDDHESEELLESWRVKFMSIYQNKEFLDVMKYVADQKKTGTPLKIYGFDSQVLSSEEPEHLIGELANFLAKNGSEISEEEVEYLLSNVELVNLSHHSPPQKNQEELKKRNRLLEKIEKGVTVATQEVDGKGARFWKQIIFNIRKEFESQGKDSFETGQIRDKTMAENLLYLMDELESEKFIGWGASYHFADKRHQFRKHNITDEYARKLSEFQPGENSIEDVYAYTQKVKPMGAWVKEQFGDAVYSLAFTAGGGGFGDSSHFISPVLEPPSGSIEHYLKAKADTTTWIDLSSSTACEMFFCSAFGAVPFLAQWDALFDGILYIPEITPVSPIRLKSIIHNRDKTKAPQITKKLNGRILSTEDGGPVAFANVSLLQTPFGSASNASGRFEVSIPVSHMKDTVAISAIGFETRFIPLNELVEWDSVTVSLNTSSLWLEEVTIHAKEQIKAKTIVKNVLQRLNENYPTQSYCLELFMRHSSYSEEDSILSRTEGVMNFLSIHGYSKTSDFGSYMNNHFAKTVQLRSGTNGKLYPSVMFDFDIIGTKHGRLVLSKAGRFDIQLEDISSYQGKKVYILSFNDKRPNPKGSNFYYGTYKGKIYVNATDYAILCYEGYLERDFSFARKKDPELYQKQPENFEDKVMEVVVNYAPQENLYYLKSGNKKYYNKASANKGKLRETEFLTTGFCETGEMLDSRTLWEHEPVPPYDKNFWDNYNILPEDDLPLKDPK